jgi:hypothetical protein
MAGWKGVNTIAGIAYSGGGSGWGSEVAVGGGHGIDFVSEQLSPDAQFIANESITGTPFQGVGAKGNEYHAGPLVMEGDFETVHRLLALFFGTAAAPVQQGSDAAYMHELTAKDDLSGIHASLVFGQTGLFVREYPTCKVGSFSMECSSGARARFTYQMVPDKLTIDDSGTNKLSTLSNITMPSAAGTNAAAITFNGLEVLINDQSAGALSGSDEYYVSAITVNANNNLREQMVTTQNAPYIDEPLRNSWFTIGGSFTLGELSSYGDYQDLLDKTTKKMTITFTGGEAATGTNYSLVLYLPAVQIESPGGGLTVDGPEVLEPSFNFVAALASSVPTGFSDTDGLKAEVVNTDSTNALTGS